MPSFAIGGGASRKPTSALRPGAGISFSTSTMPMLSRGSQTLAVGMAARRRSPFARRAGHVFFACDAEVPNSTGRLAPGVDVRGKGGYVVAAPSVHPSGAVYTVARDMPIADAPQWLVDLAMPEERPAPAPGPMPAWRCEDAKLRAIPGILSLVANARQGERNRITFWAACRFNEMVLDGLITQRLADELLLHGASRCGLNGMEILTTARSASKQGALR